MRRAVVGMVVAVSAAIAPWAGAGAADFSHLRAMAGEYSYDVLADPVLDAELRQNLGAGYDAFVEAMAVSVPSELIDNQFLILTGCMQHDCDSHRAMVIVDLDGGGLQVVRSDLYGAYIPLSDAAEAAMDAWNH
jgi:hypothetical protein